MFCISIRYVHVKVLKHIWVMKKLKNIFKTRLGFIILWASLLLLNLIVGCETKNAEEEKAGEVKKAAINTDLKIDDKTKIVSLNGTLTEILCALGYEKNIVGVDVTSTFPASMHKLPKVGHNRNIQAEGVLALTPTLIVGKQGEVKPELEQQFKAANANLQLFPMKATPEGTKQLITQVAKQLNRQAQGKKLVEKITTDLNNLEKLSAQPKVLFIYARGLGTLMVAGEGTPIQKIIEMAGGQNAISGFENFKPLTSESLVKANPDVILLFDSGLKSLEGNEGLLKVPGVKETNAGRNKAFITMDGQLLTGFGPRLGQATQELNQKLKGFTKIATK